MTTDLHTEDRPATGPGGLEAVADDEPLDRTRPNVSGDLPTIFELAPMFRRVLLGYDRFQVDTYVQWAEHQLTTAEQEREHLESRHLHALAELDEARELLSHSSGGAEFVSLSRRMGAMLAVAADEADGIRAEADAHRSAAAAEAEGTLRMAERVLADAETEGGRLVAVATSEAQERTSRADRIVEAAEAIRTAASAEAAARLEETRLLERRAAAEAGRIRRQAEDDVTAARLQAREEIVRMLTAGREERRRADAEAEADRERLDRRATALRSEIGALEQRRAALQAEVALLTEQVAAPVAERPAAAPRRLRAGSRALRAR
ncbi:hypothetical protein [Blastococcus saxobsidens]|uniref:Uncharacterized protein n=1 Tax=Blastococcus saxobsidens (strain DD2) TaxID=1146883 RepID=H6RKR8_BLASD|nr:hypothetical protein [Blastococcus saxobsidens]CCG03684.1 Conserved protein of unknown function [Blastococcus saxobsidens DD2]